MQGSFATLAYLGGIPKGLKVRGNLKLPTLRLKDFQALGWGQVPGKGPDLLSHQPLHHPASPLKSHVCITLAVSGLSVFLDPQ